jgi:DNA mismatch endonuclease (patch repair protein)
VKPGDPDYPDPSTASATAIMRANGPTETGPERRVRSALHHAGLRFRKNQVIHVDGIRTRPDVVFRSASVAVFVDGCFWHLCPEHSSQPKANSAYWAPKLYRNVDRDRRIDEALTEAGWTVVRVWEHEPVASAVTRILATLERAATA